MLSSWHEAAQAGLSHGSTAWEENLLQRSPALFLPHQPLLPCTTQPSSLGISWQHLPSLAAPSQPGSTIPDPGHSGGTFCTALTWFHFYLLLFFTTIYLFTPIFISLWTCPAVSSWFCWKCKQKEGKKKSCIQMQPFIAWIHFPSSTAPVLPPWN